MYYLVSVDHNGMAVHLSCKLLWRFLRSAVYPTQGLRLICSGMTLKRTGMLEVWGRWRHLLWWWRWWYWLVEVDRIWHALCIMRMKLIVKYCFLADVSYLESHLDYGHHTSVYIWYLCYLLVCFHSYACSWFHILSMQFFVDVSFHTMLRNLWSSTEAAYTN
jgi:hypothetical protein